MNSPRGRLIPLREKATERPTPPQGRFTALRENDVGRFREYSSRNRAFSLRCKFTPPNDKAVGKVIVPRKKANKPVLTRERYEGKFERDGSRDRVVPLSKRRFLPKDRIIPPKGKFFPLREKIADNFTFSRYVKMA